MPQLPNVLLAMQSIQAGIVEAGRVLGQLDLEELPSGERQKQLVLCSDILNSIWRTANDYEAALPKIATPFNGEKANPVAQSGV